MQKLLQYLPFHFLTGLVLGICIQYYTSFWVFDFKWILSLFLMCILLMWYFKQKFLFVMLSWVFFFGVGVAVTFLNDDRTYDSYYLNHSQEESSAVLQIAEVLKPNQFSYRYKAKVVQVDSIQTLGTVLLSLRKDSLLQGFQVDDRMLIRADFVEVTPALNPHQFDYQNYLARQGIHRQVYLNQNEFFSLESAATFSGYIAKLRTKIQNSLRNEGFSNEEFGVINALLLGQRQEVSKELLNEYSKAGAIHILAISGLHVGIILLILSWLFKPLAFFKNGKLFKLILIVCTLWFFALLAGMSASVVRAVTMFSAVALGQSLQRKNSVVYSLVFSMFILLLFNPMFLFDVGFQLSYLAVYGIVTIQPRLSALWKSKWKLIDKVWQLTTVSLAAQLAVLPLSLFYFHQFPGLFLLSNLVIVPFLGIILIGGILMMILSVSSLLPEFLVTIYGGIISWMNAFIRFVSHQESFLFSGISFSTGLMIVSYLVIIFGFRFFERRKGSRLLPFLVSIVLFQSVLLWEQYESHQQDQFLVFHKNRASVYGFRKGGKLETSKNQDRVIMDYSVGERVGIESQHQQNYWSYQGEQILIIDSLGVYEVADLKSPVVVLQYSPKINLDRLIDQLNPKQIVADGSNYKSMIRQWEQTCQQRKTPFWFTGEQGVFVMSSEGF